MTGTLKKEPSVFNIPAGISFADALAQGILARAQPDPLKLSEYTILLPSRRACRTLRDAFLRLSDGKAVLLPRLQPLGDVDADEISLLLAEGEDIPPAVSRLERQLLLAQTICHAGMASSFDQAAALAAELGHFLDEVQTEGLSFEGLQNLAPERFSEHWQKTLAFLKILTEHWPKILAERGVIDHALRRNLLLEKQIAVWEKHPPQTPIIAAGSTGTVPAAAELLSLVARLPQGMVLLPGLDTHMDDETWAQLSADHPQHNMKKLIEKIGIGRKDVAMWQAPGKKPVNAPRVRLMSEALRPAETTEHWRTLEKGLIVPQALDGFARIDCDTQQEEAGVIALLMREALETAGKTCALITPDRRLARRVSLSLRRWGITIDDSGGQPLTELPAGMWLMLTAEMAEAALAPITLLSFLKHPFMAASELRGATWLLDKLVLRGPRPGQGFEGLRQAITALDDKIEASRAKLLAWLDGIEKKTGPFVNLMSSAEDVSFQKMLTQHIRLAEELAGAERLWQGEAGEAAAELLGNLLASASSVPDLNPRHYVSLLRTLLKSETVRPRHSVHPRLSILGQIEARLYCADMVILGSLNEGTWPGLPAPDPWMSRQMRQDFGLPPPEKSLSLAAHDFVQAATAPEVVITRARKIDGTPAVPARWLLRLETVLKAAGIEWVTTPSAKYRQWLKDMDAPKEIKPAQRPQPRPPVEARPKKLSVTRIETWMRDPYQIYARYVLGLESLDPIDADAGGAERGTFIHAALEKFIKGFPDTLPEDAAEQLTAFGRQALADMHIPQEVEAFWWPRFEKIAVHFIAQEREWRKKAKPLLTEAAGTLQTEDGFTLTGKADRIDKLSGGGYAIIDYKSGQTPKTADVRSGASPQLPLEALMLEKGAFKELDAGEAQELVYWHVAGGGQKPVEMISINPEGCPVAQLVREAEAGLKKLVAEFDNPATPYLSRPDAAILPKFSDYDHLARVKEWAVSGGEEE